MKRLLVCFLAVAFVLWAGNSFAASNVGVKSDPPLVTGTGGPDDYGYTWIDSDSAGGPNYQWVDITTKAGAVEITSMMGDDNVVGPLDVGFDFNYYWYTVDHCYIGSNGYISFADNDNYSHPFSMLPFTGSLTTWCVLWPATSTTAEVMGSSGTGLMVRTASWSPG